MASSGPWQHPTTGSPAAPQQKRRRGRPRKVVDPTTTISPAVPQQKRPRGRPRKVVVSATGGGSVGGHTVQGNTNKEAAFGSGGGIGVAQGSGLSDSGMPTYGSQHVPASVEETRVSHGEQSQERMQTIRPFGTVGPSNPIADSPYNIDLISQQFPGFPFYVQLLQNPGLSALPFIQQNLQMSVPDPSLQQPTSSTLLSWPTERFPMVSSSAFRHPVPMVPFNHSYRNTSSVPAVSASAALQHPITTQLTSPMVSASALQHHISMEPSNQSYRNTSGVPTVSSSALQHPNTTNPSNQSYRNCSSHPEWF